MRNTLVRASIDTSVPNQAQLLGIRSRPCFIGLAYSSRETSAHSCSISKISLSLARAWASPSIDQANLCQEPIDDWLYGLNCCRNRQGAGSASGVKPSRRSSKSLTLDDYLSRRIVASCACASPMRRTIAAAMLESALGLACATVGAAGQTRSTTLELSLGLMSWMLNRSALVIAPSARVILRDYRE